MYRLVRDRAGVVTRAFTLVELLVVIAIIGILVALLLPAIQAAREAARRAQCQSNIHNVAIAVLNYEDSNKILPNGMTFNPANAASVHTLSQYGPNWIIMILPYLEEQDLFDSFNLAVRIDGGTAPNPLNVNRTARGRSISVLLCPSDGYNQVMYRGKTGSPHGNNWARGNYAANAGRAFIRGGSGLTRMSSAESPGWTDNCQRGVMGPNTAVTLRRITDGTSKTIMLGEIRAGLTDQDGRGVWALGAAGASLLARYGAGGDANGPNSCDNTSDDVYADICDPSYASPPNSIAKGECMTCQGGDLFQQATTRSKHPGGVHVAMCDGSVQFISDDIETSGGANAGECCTVWDWMIASADGGQGGVYNGISVEAGGCRGPN